MLLGQYQHSLDDKCRLMIPSKMKAELSDASTLYVLKGFEGCLAVYTKSEFDKLVTKLQGLSYFDTDSRNFIRLTLSSVIQLNVDKLGRIQFTPSTLEKYKISKEVIVVGVNDHFEVWDKKAYLDYEDKLSSKYEELANSMVKTNDK